MLKLLMPLLPSVSYPRIPSLVVKNKQDLILATSAFGLASPSVLTPTPSVIKGSESPSKERKEDDGVAVKKSESQLESLDDAGLPPSGLASLFSSSSSPLSQEVVQNSQSLGQPQQVSQAQQSSPPNKRKRAHTSGHSISSTGSFLNITTLLSTSDTTTHSSPSSSPSPSERLSPSHDFVPPRPMSPPSPPTVAFVTACRSSGEKSSALEGLRAVSCFDSPFTTTSVGGSISASHPLLGLGGGIDAMTREKAEILTGPITSTTTELEECARSRSHTHALLHYQ
ncbi:hypothetical protein K435DRAFT_247414 [Dendrothele bispora CBS 962.96]|uniref:Uncharacterized protein n=1 Tax=Dendrothele bispora (strain CBS 962.96) TaxID=1314807 RepID=A0A4S8LNY0_DENBC|nr:hypothetical protein K435DRAFT_247414 [Dendrothele bispora CBS 962.96]